MSGHIVFDMFLWRCAVFMLREAHCMLSETEGNAKLIHYVRGNVLFSAKGCFNKAGGGVCRGVPASAGSLAIFSPENSALVFVFEALDCNISLLPHSWPYYITVGEGWQWKLWQHGSEWLSKWSALCMAVGLFSAPCLKERMAAVCSQMLATAGPLQTISGTMLSSGWVPACVSKPSLFLMSQLQERAMVTNTLLCCILMCANQLNSGPDI